MKRASLQVRIGEVVRRHREKNEYTQEGFADHIKMHRAYYGAIERGQKNLQLTTLERVCDGLDVPMWEVMRDAQTR
ncbi:MAG: helix-turn-helix transcriptional regulator [Gammaproteobacteria bacterium]